MVNRACSKEQVQNDILKHFINVAKSLGIKVDENIKVDIADPNRIYACWVFCDDIIKYKENEEETGFMMNLCKKYNKFMSGGSDYHAKNKPTTFMGTGINNNIIVIYKNTKKPYIRLMSKIILGHKA